MFSLESPHRDSSVFEKAVVNEASVFEPLNSTVFHVRNLGFNCVKSCEYSCLLI